MVMITPLTYSIDETAALIGIGRNAAYEAARRGDIPTIRIGKRLLVPKMSLERLLEGRLSTDKSVVT